MVCHLDRWCFEIAYSDQQFEQFCNNIRMSDDVVEDVRRKYHRITKCINSAYWNLNSENQHSLYVGSYGRGTSIGYSDIDIVVQLPYHIYSKFDGYLYNGQSSLLQDVKSVLKNTYPQSEISGDGQVITISFQSIIFEILPGFVCNDGSFVYPDSNAGGSWRKTDPRSEIKAFDKVNKETNGNLKRLCRMIRSWNYYNNLNLDGQFIDVTCHDYLKSYVHKDKSYLYYDEIVRDYFNYLYENCNRSYWHMPGSNRNVMPNRTFRNTVINARDLCISAINSQNNGHMYTACNTWRDLFGYKFPSY